MIFIYVNMLLLLLFNLLLLLIPPVILRIRILLLSVVIVKDTSPGFAEVFVEDFAEDLLEGVVEGFVEDLVEGLSFFPFPLPLAPSFLGCALALASEEGFPVVGVWEERPLPLVDCFD